MTDSNYTHLGVIVDRSGSMSSMASDMRGGLNEFFKEQAKLPGKCLVDYAMFDDEYTLVYEDRFITEAKAELAPRGMTALLDAVGKTITNLGEKFAKMKEGQRPGRVLVLIVTDGYENASRDWKKPAVKKLIEDQQSEYDWDFVFLGANMDAVSEGADMGTRTTSNLTFDRQNVSATMGSLNTYTTQYRSGGAAAFTDEDRKNSVTS